VGTLKPTDPNMISLGQPIEYQITTDNYVDQKSQWILMENLKKYPIKINYFGFEGNTVTLQAETIDTSLTAVAFIALLPTIFLLAGLILVAIAIYSIYASTPSWIIGILAVGVVLLVSGYAITGSGKKRLGF